MGFWVEIKPGRHRYFDSEKAMHDALGSKFEGHFVIDDTMEDTWHPADGRHYSSKRMFRAVTKAHGCVELDGMNMNPGKAPLDVGKHYDVAKGIHDIMEANRIDHKDVARDIIRHLETEERMRHGR